MLDATPRVGPFILTRGDGRPWHTDKDDKALAKVWHVRMVAAGFYPAGWDDMTKEEKCDCLRFSDQRGTAVTLLSEAGKYSADLRDYGSQPAIGNAHSGQIFGYDRGAFDVGNPAI